MVNYCCVYGCGRNNKTSKHLFYYGLPKDNPRLEQWLSAIGREDLLEKNLKKLSYRVCSRHFAPSSIKNKHLCADAIPTMCLPTHGWEEQDDDEQQTIHSEIICNSCKKPILGFRYKCITCPDYDLCSKCEMFEAHADHYVLRIPKPVHFKVADDLIKKWQRFVNIEHVTVDTHATNDGSSDDDLPIKRYIKNDNGIDLSEDMKAKIRSEVARVLSITHEPNKKKRKKESKRKDPSKKKKIGNTIEKSCSTKEFEAMVPEVVFADVNDIRGAQILDIKDEIPANTASILEGPVEPISDLNFTDADFMLTNLS